MRKTFLSLFFALFIFASSNKNIDAFSCSSNGTGGGNFNVAATWTTCNSTTPQTTDSIIINNGDTVTLVATTTVSGITINNGGILDANTRALTNTDGYTNNGSHTGTTATMILSGPVGSVINGSGTYSPTGIVTISTGAKTIASGSHLSFDKVTITGVVLTNNSTAGFTVVTALAGTGQLVQGANSILNIGGTSAITSFDASVIPNEVHYTSTAANQTIKSPTSSYYNLFIDKAGRVGTLAAATTVNGNLTVTAGTLADGGFQITGNGTGVFTLAAGTTLTLGTNVAATNFPTNFTSGNMVLNTTSTVNYNSSQTQTISNLPNYGNLATTTTGVVTKTAAGAFTVNGTFTNGTNNTFADGGFTITLKDGCTMTGSHTGSGKILFAAGSGQHSVSGTFSNIELNDSNGLILSGTTTINGTLTLTNGTFDTDARTIVVTGITTINSTLLISSTTGTKTFGDIVVANGGILNFTAAETLAENGNLTINNGGTMNFSAAAIINLAGDLLVNGTGTITGATGLWTFQKVGGGTIDGTVSSLVISGNVTFATQYVISYPFTVNNLTVNSGVVETNTSTITSNGTLGGTGTFTQNPNTTLNVHSISITTLNATASNNTIHILGGVAGTIKGTTYVNLDINKPTGFTATANGTVNVTGNFTITSGTFNFASSTFTVTGNTDIYDTLTDSSGGVAGGNNLFLGSVNIHPGAHWTAVVGEVCDFHFENGLVMNGTSFVSSTGVYYFETNNQSITGSSSFTIDNISVTGIQLTNSSTGTITSRVSLSGTGTFKQDVNAILTIGGTNTISTFDGSALGNTVSYTGTVVQIIKDGIYNNLDVSSNTSNNVNLSANTSVNTLLTLGATLLTTSSNKIILAAGATLSRTSGYIFGTIEKVFNSSTSFTFDIGDSNIYSPIGITLLGVTGIGSIDASVINSYNPDIANSGIDSTKSVNRYWSLINNGLTYTSYSTVLNFASSDIVPGVNTADMSIAKKSSGSWNLISATCIATSCAATGLTSMSEFQIGVPIPVVNTSPSTTSNVPTIAIPLKRIIKKLSVAPKALFDVIASPLSPKSSATIIPVVASTFLLGSLGSFGVIAAAKRRHKKRRI